MFTFINTNTTPISNPETQRSDPWGIFNKKSKNIPVSPPISDFPTDVLKWIKKNNAKPKMILKFMQICQYFQFQEFPYLVVINLWGHCRHNLSHWSYQPLGINVRLNVKTFNKPLWILDSLRLTKFDKLPETTVCDLYTLVLADVNMSINEFKLLTSAKKLAQFYLTDSVISDEKGEVLRFKELFEYLPCINSHNFPNSLFSYQEELGGTGIRQEFYQIEECLNFFQNNQHIFFTFFIFDCRDDKVTQRLQTATDKLIETWSPKNKPPEIYFEGQSMKSKEDLQNLKQSFLKMTKMT